MTHLLLTGLSPASSGLALCKLLAIKEIWFKIGHNLRNVVFLETKLEKRQLPLIIPSSLVYHMCHPIPTHFMRIRNPPQVWSAVWNEDSSKISILNIIFYRTLISPTDTAVSTAWAAADSSPHQPHGNGAIIYSQFMNTEHPSGQWKST